MNSRPFWTSRIHEAWKKRPIVWLSGVRRVGKTTLAKMFPEALYINCDLPSSLSRTSDPESFFSSVPKSGVVIFDEVHRIEDPSRLLKIGADEFPSLRILATGSSTLSATKKFRDSLTGRKTTIYLPPILWRECSAVFGVNDLDRRLLNGGMPEQFLSEKKDPGYFAEWIEGFYARDIQELFTIRNRTGFLTLFRLLMLQSGGMLDYASLSMQSGISGPTAHAHTEALAIAQALFLLPPFHGGGAREIVKRAKGYAFDTGFITFVKGWDTIRSDDRGILWEHLVLDELRSSTLEETLHFWRDKSGREIDFVITRNENRVDAIECKVNPDRFETKNLEEFRKLYPNGNNYVVSPFSKIAYKKNFGDVAVTFCLPEEIHTTRK
jgi:uncharacterized protein